MLALRIVGLPDAAQHDLQMEILGPGMEPVEEPMQTQFGMAPSDDAPPGWESHALLPVGMQFQAAEEGTYTLNVSVDGVSKSFPFRVIVGAPTA